MRELAPHTVSQRYPGIQLVFTVCLPGVQNSDGVGKGLLAKLAKSNDLWKQRVSVMFTWAHIRAGQPQVTLDQVEKLLNHPHDLIHKASGWMLREVGKKDVGLLRGFLASHAAVMPRVMLRYAIEKLNEKERAKWLNAS